MGLVIISAISLNRVIGRGGGLPWRLPDDTAHFKRTTMGAAVIMGRRTFESDSGVLPGRLNIVVTRDRGWGADGVETAPSVEAAGELARAQRPGTDAFVIGGGEIYALALPIAERLELTVVHAVVEGDTRFPAYGRGAFELTRAVFHPADERHAFAMTFLSLVRR